MNFTPVENISYKPEKRHAITRELQNFVDSNTKIVIVTEEGRAIDNLYATLHVAVRRNFSDKIELFRQKGHLYLRRIDI